MVKNLYYKGKGTEIPVLTNPAPANRVLDGYDFINEDGVRQEGTVSSRSGYTITPGRYAQTVAANQYLTGNITIEGSPNLISSNIRSGVNIFGVNGSYEGSSVGTFMDTRTLSGNGGVIRFGFAPSAFYIVDEEYERAATRIWGLYWQRGLNVCYVLGSQSTVKERMYTVTVTSGDPVGFSSISINVTSSYTLVTVAGTSNGWTFKRGSSKRIIGIA